MTGVTVSERYLGRLCRRSFLRLWSWPNLYRDQRWGGGRAGKELCDLLVLFHPHVIIFSDKECSFPDTDREETDWSRWFRRAVFSSAKQLWGAERWLADHPDRVFTDVSCTHPLPIPLPVESERKVHRIVVAHGSAERCKKFFGGSGSLILKPSIIGEAHWNSQHSDFSPFTIGTLDPSKGYVHVFDDTTLDIVLRTLDTLPDLVDYLQAKEELVANGRLEMAAGEEELLALFLQSMHGNRHVFPFSPETKVLVFEGSWKCFEDHPQRRAQVAANEISYLWDNLIDKFTHHVLTGTTEYQSHSSITDFERGIRLMAAESRTRRRVLARSLLGILRRGNEVWKATRVVVPEFPDSTYYVFMSLDPEPESGREAYHEFRHNMLAAYCKVLKTRYPQALDIIGIAAEPERFGSNGSEDLLFLDGRLWTEEFSQEAQNLQKETGILADSPERWFTAYEYPLPR